MEGRILLERSFVNVYTKFKMNYYRKIFSRFETREAHLTAVETFCVEVIHALGEPTVNEFAQYVSISQPNATHKIQNLIKKGYVEKIQSDSDRREFTLKVTDKYFQYYNVSNNYVLTVMKRMRERFSTEEIATFTNVLRIMSEELMTEVALGDLQLPGVE